MSGGWHHGGGGYHGGVAAGLARRGVGTLEMPTLAWKQIGVGLFVGIGLGYVLFATK